jgi:hypothetical protein
MWENSCNCPAYKNYWCKHLFAVDAYIYNDALDGNDLPSSPLPIEPAENQQQAADANDGDVESVADSDRVDNNDSVNVAELKQRLMHRFSKMVETDDVIELQEIENVLAVRESHRVGSFIAVERPCPRRKTSADTVVPFRKVGKFTKIKAPGRPKKTKKMPGFYDPDDQPVNKVVTSKRKKKTARPSSATSAPTAPTAVANKLRRSKRLKAK